MQHCFVQDTILSMGPVSFNRMKEALLREYVQFHIVESKNVTKTVLIEKLYDYFEKIHCYIIFEDLVIAALETVEGLSSYGDNRLIFSIARKLYRAHSRITLNYVKFSACGVF